MEFLGIFLIAAFVLWLFWKKGTRLKRYRALAEKGIATDAVVVRKSRQPLPRKNGYRHYLEYQFTTREGADLFSRVLVSAQEYRDSEPGQRIVILYDPQTPEFNRSRSFLVRKKLIEAP
jgi:hypothetical protein